MCETECQLFEHRCSLCRRYLPVSVVEDGRTRHDNCGSTGGNVDVFGASRLRWLPVGPGWCLGAGEEVVVMAPVGENWKLASYRNGRVETLHEELPVDWAMGIGEDRSKAFGKLAERKAGWLRLEPTHSQLGRLEREGLPSKHLNKVATRGDAADLLTRIQGRRAMRKLGVAV